VPESFKVLIKELQALCLDVKVLDADKNVVEIPELDPEDTVRPEQTALREELTPPEDEYVPEVEPASIEEYEDLEDTEFTEDDFALDDMDDDPLGDMSFDLGDLGGDLDL
jgi:DNA-directed RNA polymerase subunit beta